VNNEVGDDGYYLETISGDQSLLEEISLLEEDDVMAMAEIQIADRGYGYYCSGYVMQWEEKENSISATVSGSYENHYEVNIFIDDKDMLAICSCPYDDTCKHIIATLLQVKNSVVYKKDEKTVLNEEAIFLEEVKRMDRDTLIELVTRFASENYKKSIILQHISKDDVDNSLEKIKHLITYTLRSKEFMYDPGALFVAVSAYLDELSAHIKVAPSKTFEVLLFMIEEIEVLEEEGYLYQDSCNWYSEAEYFDYDTLNSKILKMIESVEDMTLQAEIFLDYIGFCENSDYFYCDFNNIKIRDKTLLLQGLDEISSLSFYTFIKDALSYQEKLDYLEQFDTDRVVDEMVDMYLKANKKAEAIIYVERLLEKRFRTGDAEILLRLIPVNKMDKTQLFTLLESAITSNDYNAKVFIVKYIDQCTEQSKLESLLKKYKVHWYYDYLKKAKRVEEMHSILGKVSSEKKDFYHHYKERYKEEAIAFYKTNINEDLQFTGNNYYESIAYFLKELKPLLSQEEFSNIVMNLKTDYKRRRNFVKILTERF